ncbi:porphobilinogen synthase [Phycisphaerales bacterium AB-hyl4]|uniref:Delta-aminolevulinic acid dehydratase n=1 Tax=Natronomicrosphaera hydrolytica TaxID=3242702 RepID=A0ABV4U553_9BACT
MSDSSFPQQRLRRLRRGQRLRDAVADVGLSADRLIYPLFVGEMREAKPVASMPGVKQLPVDAAVNTMRDLIKQGVQQFILFGVTADEHKDAHGSFAASPDAPVNRTLRAAREAGLDAVLYADLCFCEYTEHGHCGALLDTSTPTGAVWTVDNDRTLALLGQTAVAQAEAGADVVAPSGMMDGQVAAIRQALDAAGHEHAAILSYAIKYASSFYGPFREAGGGGMQFGDRRGYQMDYRRSREWQSELHADLAEGADMVMVKPAMAYLDIVQQVRSSCDVPVAAYHVSGEYAMLHAAAERGWLDLEQAALESTYAIRRAGADLVVTYFAPQLAMWV